MSSTALDSASNATALTSNVHLIRTCAELEQCLRSGIAEQGEAGCKTEWIEYWRGTEEEAHALPFTSYRDLVHNMAIVDLDEAVRLASYRWPGKRFFMAMSREEQDLFLAKMGPSRSSPRVRSADSLSGASSVHSTSREIAPTSSAGAALTTASRSDMLSTISTAVTTTASTRPVVSSVSAPSRIAPTVSLGCYPTPYRVLTEATGAIRKSYGMPHAMSGFTSAALAAHSTPASRQPNALTDVTRVLGSCYQGTGGAEWLANDWRGAQGREAQQSVGFDPITLPAADARDAAQLTGRYSVPPPLRCFRQDRESVCLDGPGGPAPLARRESDIDLAACQGLDARERVASRAAHWEEMPVTPAAPRASALEAQEPQMQELFRKFVDFMSSKAEESPRRPLVRTQPGKTSVTSLDDAVSSVSQYSRHSHRSGRSSASSASTRYRDVSGARVESVADSEVSRSGNQARALVRYSKSKGTKRGGTKKGKKTERDEAGIKMMVKGLPTFSGRSSEPLFDFSSAIDDAIRDYNLGDEEAGRYAKNALRGDARGMVSASGLKGWREIRKALVARYAVGSDQVISEFESAVQGKNETVSEYAHRLKGLSERALHARLGTTAAGVNVASMRAIQEDSLISVFKSGIHPHVQESVQLALDANLSSRPTFECVKQCALKYESRSKRDKKTVQVYAVSSGQPSASAQVAQAAAASPYPAPAPVVAGGVSAPAQASGPPSRKQDRYPGYNVTCFGCNGQGHIQRFCPNRQQGGQGGGGVQGNRQFRPMRCQLCGELNHRVAQCPSYLAMASRALGAAPAAQPQVQLPVQPVAAPLQGGQPTLQQAGQSTGQQPLNC